MADNTELGRFFSDLALVEAPTRKVQERLDRALASKFSPFNLMLRSQTTEKQLSEVFRFLLDPTEVHGQGRRFLDAFFALVGLPVSDKKVRQVVTEFKTQEGRRIDIVVIFECGFHIGIENKPWYENEERPSDLENQVRDYCSDLRRRSRDNWALIYLSGAGLDPPGHSIENSEWEKLESERVCFRMSYSRELEALTNEGGELPSIAQWIRECIEQCEAEAVRSFLKDLLRYVGRLSNRDVGDATMAEQTIAEFIMVDGERLRLATDVRGAMDRVNKMLIEAYLSRVVAEIEKALGPSSEWIINSAKADESELMGPNATLVALRRRTWGEVCVGLEATKRDCTDIIIGVWSEPKKGDLTPRQREKLFLELKGIGLQRTENDNSKGWFPAYAVLGDLGWFKSFDGHEFFERARRIRMNEPDNDVKRLADFLADVAQRADRVLSPDKNAAHP